MTLFPHFPVFLDLTGRAVVLIGGEPALAALAQQALSAGASVSAFDPAPSAELRDLAPPVRLKLRRWRPADFTGARLVIAGASEPQSRRAQLAAHAVGAVFHLLGGSADESDVALGGVTARGALTLGVSMPGLPGALADAVQARLERALPEGFSLFLEAAARARDEVERRYPDAEARDRFWSALGDAAMHATHTDAEHWDAFIAARL